MDIEMSHAALLIRMGELEARGWRMGEYRE